MKTANQIGFGLGIALAVSLTACQKPAATAPAVDTTKISDTIKADVAQLVTDFNAKDAEKSVSHDGPDYVGMFHGMANVHGPAEDLALTKQQMADASAKVAVSNEAVDTAASGDMAVYRATYAYTFTDPKTKQPTTENGNWVLGYRKQSDGTWKLSFGVVSDTPTASTAKSG